MPPPPSPQHEPYRIRLRGPWEVAWLGDAPDAAAQVEFVTVYLPETWTELFGACAGRALFRRRFNRIPNLEAGDQVCVVLTEAFGEVRVRCNGRPVPAAESTPTRCAYDVTASLQDFNRLEVEIACDPSESPHAAAGLWQPVVLEIHSGS